MNAEQLSFWNRQSQQGNLITAVELHRCEAIRIFGPTDVENEFLPGLRETLEAYRIVLTPAPDLQTELNCIMQELAKLLGRKSELQKIRFTENDISRMKSRAESRLNEVLTDRNDCFPGINRGIGSAATTCVA